MGISDRAADTFRDYETAGVPASGAHEPQKSAIRQTFVDIDYALNLLSSAGIVTNAVVYPLRSQLYADLAHSAGAAGIVWNDGVNNGLFFKSGASGSGSWTATGLLLTGAKGDKGDKGDAGDAGDVANIVTARDEALGEIGAAGTTQIGNVTQAGNAFLAQLPGNFPTLAAALAGEPEGGSARIVQPSGIYQDTYTKTGGALVLQKTDAYGDGILLDSRRALQTSPGFIALPWAPDFDIDPIDALHYLGLGVPNSAGPAPSRNLLQRIADTSVFGAATFTPDYATDKWGRANKAHRVQVSNATAVLLFSAPIAGSYRARFWAKSTPGAGAQSITINADLTGGASTPLTEGAWTLIDVVFELSLNTAIAVTYNGATTTDAIVTEPQISFGETELNQEPDVPNTGGLVRAGLALPNWLALPVRGNNQPRPCWASPLNGRIIIGTDDKTARSLAGFTILYALKKSGTENTAGPTPLVEETPGGFSSGIFVGEYGGGGVPHFKGPGIGSAGIDIAAPNASLTLNDGLWHILALTFLATASAAYIDGMKVLTGTGTGGTPYQLATLLAGGQGFGGSSPFAGYIGRHVGRFAGSSDAEIAQASASMRQRMMLFGELEWGSRILLGQGDSNIGGSIYLNAAQEWFEQTGGALGARYLNNAQGGRYYDGSYSGTSVLDQQAADEQWIKAAVAMGLKPVQVFNIGTNKFATADQFTSYVKRRQMLGADVVLATLLGRKPGETFGGGLPGYTQADQDTYNAMIRSLAASLGTRLIDWQTNSAVGTWNSTNFADGLHLNATGTTQAVAVATPILAAALE